MSYSINIGTTTNFQIENNTDDVDMIVNGAMTVGDLTVTGTTTITNFASTGITDNATEESLVLTDNSLMIGAGDLGSTFHIGSASIGGDTRISYGVGGDGTSQSAIAFFGGAHSTSANDIQIRSGGISALVYDKSATTWDFLTNQIISQVTTGTAPFTVASTTLVANLNADLLDGLEAAGFPNRTDTTTDPTATDDLANYQIGSIWVNTTDNGIFINVDNTDDAAIWTELGVGGGTGDLKADGSVPLTADWDAGSFDITAEQFHSDIVTGTSPFTVASTTVVANLNADTVDGFEAAGFPNRTDSASDPVATDDLANHQVGSIWINTTDNGIFVNVDNTDDAAIWTELSPGTGTGDLKSDGTVALSADWDVGPHAITAEQFHSDIVTGTSPFTVASTTVVTNLNADTVDGFEAAGFPNRTDSASDPVATDDLANHQVGSIWVNTSDNGIFINVDNTDDAAIWTELAAGTGSGDLKADGTIPLTANWDVGAFDITAEQFHSDITTGTSPFTVASTTVVTNLNADTVDGVEATELGQLAVASEWTKTQNFNATTLTPLGSDVVTNGAFAADTDWTKGTGWTIGSGVASSDGTQVADSDLTQSITPTSGKTYQVTYTISNYSTGMVTAVVGDVEANYRMSDGTYTEYIVSGAGTDIDIRADSLFVGDIDNVIVKLANVSWDLESNQVSTLTLDGNLVLDNPTNLKDGASYSIRLVQDATGSRTLTYGSVYKWPGGSSPTLTTTGDAIDIITFMCDGTNMYGVISKDFS